jgi:hypothetical protein
VTHLSPSVIATWICVILVLFVVFGVMRAVVKPLVAVALVAIILVALGVLRADQVGHVARDAVHAIYRFVASLIGAAKA